MSGIAENPFYYINDVFMNFSGQTVTITGPPTVAVDVPDSSRVANVVFLYGGLVALSLSLYSIMRKHWPEIVIPRLNGCTGTARVGASHQSAARSFCKLFDIDLSWSWKALAYREADLVRLCGVDGYVLIRVVRFCWAVSTGYCLVALFFLFPTYYAPQIESSCVGYCAAQSSKGDDGDVKWESGDHCICGLIDRASMATISSSSGALWVPVIVIYIFTAMTLVACVLEYRAMVRIRGVYWDILTPEAYSVLVEHIPTTLRDVTGRKLWEYFDSIFPNKVVSVEMYDTGSELFETLVQIGEERNWVLWKLERAKVKQQQRLGGGSTNAYIRRLEEELKFLNGRFTQYRKRYERDISVRRSHLMPHTATNRRFPSSGKKNSQKKGPASKKPKKRSVSETTNSKTVSSNGGVSPEVLGQHPEATTVVDMEQANPEKKVDHDDKEEEIGDDDDNRSTVSKDDENKWLTKDEHLFHGKIKYFSSAFVTFQNLVTSSVATQSQIDEISAMRVCLAPEPLDVAWENVGMSLQSRMFRRVFTKAIFYLLLLFWGVFTSIIGAATSTQALARQFPVIRETLVQNPRLAEYLDMLAPLILITLVGVVNPLMGLLARYEGRISESEAERRAMERYFVFSVIQVFVFYSVAGTVFKTFVEILQQPSKIVNTLGSTIPKNAAFYIQFIVVKLFWMLCFELLRGGEMFLAMFRRILVGYPVTNREKVSLFCGIHELQYPGPKNFSSTLAQILLVFFIAIVYSVIQPLILPAAFVFFALANVVYTTSLTTASKQMYDSGGKFWWNSSYRCIVLGLVIAQLTLLGVLLIKEAYRQTLPMWVLFIVTLWFSYKIEARYGPLVANLSVHLASKLDHKRANLPVRQVRPSYWQYGAICHGENLTKQEKRDSLIVYSYKHPIFQEPLIEKPRGERSSSTTMRNGENEHDEYYGGQYGSAVIV